LGDYGGSNCSTNTNRMVGFTNTDAGTNTMPDPDA
jgi:hypothetical protein